MMLKTIQCKNFDEMSTKAADFVAAEITSSKKQFSIALPGGSSVTGILKELACKRIAWQAVNVFMSDERVVPLDDKESNYNQANELFFSKVQGVHAFAFDKEKGIDDYNKKFMAVTKGKLDLVVLGVGEDGHIASLFPNNPALKSGETGYVPVENSQKLPAKRISLSHEAIANAQHVILLFASASKRQAYEKFIDNNVKEADCPAKIALKAKRTTVFTVFGG